ncbi:polysaccharide deacetylase family protein [Paenibacillus sp. sgz500958]|uniref:polysaccharide deacetylase family protein n=1 Tax=Paenibacillus sp. sgz500958 TaxID=3242475 RepID=UPI0036D3506F
MKLEKTAIILACTTVIIGIGSTSGPVKAMLREISPNQSVIEVWKSILPATSDDKLRMAIEEKAAKLNAPPVDAVLDRVWKAVPGYNGLEVDVEESYRKSLALPSPDGKPKLVYKQIVPGVSLKDLGAQPIYRGNPRKPMVSLMINVAWGNEYILPMLDILDEEKVKATFFLDGSWLNKNSELALEMLKRGHELENHAYTHPQMSRLSRERATLEIDKTRKLLEKLGVKNTWFAPPSGDFDQETVEIASGLGLRTVLWTLDTVDWRNPSPESVVTKITSKVEPGFLILMHPTNSSSKALKGMISGIKAKGLQLGTVSQTLSSERILPSEVE